ncbi:MAG: oligosaccharide flippase family protein [Coriobacteriia bacterium]|nr:oligosaccharide flippase family protein [Coriobacteriia bacterium]
MAARAAIWFTLAGVIQKSVSVLTMPIFTRMLSTEQYGLYALYNSWLQVLTILTTLRLTYAVFNKGMSRYGDDREGFTSTMQGVTSIMTLVGLGLYLAAQDWVNALTGLPTLITVAMFAELLMTPAISFWIARERYRFRYRPIVYVTLLQAVANAGLGVIAVVLAEDKGVARILSIVAVQVVVGLFFYVRNILKAPRPFVFEYAKFAVTFNLPLIPHYLSMYAMDQFDRVMIARMVGLSAAALYTVAVNVGLVLKLVTDGITQSLVPWMYQKLEEGRLEDIESRIGQILVLVSVVVLVFIAVAPELVSLLGGSRYEASVNVVPPIAVSIVFIFAYTIFANVQFHYDANKFIMVASTVGAFANVGLNYVMIPRYGFIAAAYTTLLCYVGFAFAHYLFMNHVVSRRTDGRRILAPITLVGISVSLILGAWLLAALYDHAAARYGFTAVLVVVLAIRREDVRGVFR